MNHSTLLDVGNRLPSLNTLTALVWLVLVGCVPDPELAPQQDAASLQPDDASGEGASGNGGDNMQSVVAASPPADCSTEGVSLSCAMSAMPNACQPTATRDSCAIPGDDADCNGIANEGCTCPYYCEGNDLRECGLDGAPDHTLMTCAFACNPAAATGAASCALPRDIAAGGSHTCVVFPEGQVKCWGRGSTGSLGYGDTLTIGDDETPAAVGFVDIGEPVKQIVAGDGHTCALTESGAVSCWGRTLGGGLGYPGVTRVGDDETPASVGFVDVGGPAIRIAAGESHFCAVLANNRLRCWGDGSFGALGYGDELDIGFTEAPSSRPEVEVGNSITTYGDDTVDVVAGAVHTCALLNHTSDVRCWGRNQRGELGYGNTEVIGDNETPASRGSVDVGGDVIQITAGNVHTCALLSTGNVRCWGDAVSGQNGYGSWDPEVGTTISIGDDAGDTPAAAGDLDLGGGRVTQISASGAQGMHTCALFESGDVQCWGEGTGGRLGHGNTATVGDDETPGTVGFVQVGGRVKKIAAGALHTCAVMETGAVRCWGAVADGRLGYGSAVQSNVGDDEDPAAAGDVTLL